MIRNTFFRERAFFYKFRFSKFANCRLPFVLSMKRVTRGRSKTETASPVREVDFVIEGVIKFSV